MLDFPANPTVNQLYTSVGKSWYWTGTAWRLVSSAPNNVFIGPIRPGAYTVALLPSAAAYTGGLVYVTNASGGSEMCYSDGTNWRRCQDRSLVS